MVAELVLHQRLVRVELVGLHQHRERLACACPPCQQVAVGRETGRRCSGCCAGKPRSRGSSACNCDWNAFTVELLALPAPPRRTGPAGGRSAAAACVRPWFRWRARRPAGRCRRRKAAVESHEVRRHATPSTGQGARVNIHPLVRAQSPPGLAARPGKLHRRARRRRDRRHRRIPAARAFCMISKDTRPLTSRMRSASGSRREKRPRPPPCRGRCAGPRPRAPRRGCPPRRTARSHAVRPSAQTPACAARSRSGSAAITARVAHSGAAIGGNCAAHRVDAGLAADAAARRGEHMPRQPLQVHAAPGASSTSRMFSSAPRRPPGSTPCRAPPPAGAGCLLSPENPRPAPGRDPACA
jgi:hypothetical protein